ncbi:hypothetical protein F2Q69_00031253 [Brassica cretica]|uniref:Uncharacterized protein n=1 Tax=Brassica cretica TaxID=69181 RepID=A0A8S9S791_BRACR|nr:hypothetical protein F2Q69_00031253 [Brassica cretica]
MEGLLLAGILGTGVLSSGDPEAGVLTWVWRNSIPDTELDLRKSISLLLNPLVSLEPICRCLVWSLSVNGYYPTLMTKSRNKGQTVGENILVSFPPASRQDPDPRVPDKGTLQVPAKRDPEFEVSVGEQTSLESRDSRVPLDAGAFRRGCRRFSQGPAAGELLHELIAENCEGGYGPGCGAIICLYAGERELPGHLDQGDLICEGSVGVGIGVALPYEGRYP